jgi:hypothetical protein
MQCTNAGQLKDVFDGGDAVATAFARNPTGFLPWHG